MYEKTLKSKMHIARSKPLNKIYEGASIIQKQSTFAQVQKQQVSFSHVPHLKIAHQQLLTWIGGSKQTNKQHRPFSPN